MTPNAGTARAANVAPKVPLAYGTSDVCRLTGLTPRQVQWIDEQRIVNVQHVGHRRVFSADDIVMMRLITRFRSAGLAMRKFRQFLPALGREIKRRGVPKYIIVATSRVAFVNEGEAAVDRLIQLQRAYPSERCVAVRGE